MFGESDSHFAVVAIFVSLVFDVLQTVNQTKVLLFCVCSRLCRVDGIDHFSEKVGGGKERKQVKKLTVPFS
jgi:hypothetical protein